VGRGRQLAGNGGKPPGAAAGREKNPAQKIKLPEGAEKNLAMSANPTLRNELAGRPLDQRGR